jgi:Domain of unknown function (DUF4292)
MLRRRNLAAILALVFMPLSACLVRRREIAPAARRPNRPLLSATREELIQRVQAIFDPLGSFLMRAEISPSVINPAKGAVTDYATVSAFILFHKPNDIRIIGQDPVLHTTIFDMASMGKEFRIYITHGNRFLVGDNDVPGTSKNKLEDLRPGALLSALLIYPPNPQTEVTLLENDTEENQAVYVLLIIRREQNELMLDRNIYFDRTNLQITRQKIFNGSGTVVGDTAYSNWKTEHGISFPYQIDIQRPQDNYEVQLAVSNMEFNTARVTPEKFVLTQPEGTHLEQLK